MYVETERLLIDDLKAEDKEAYFRNISHDKEVLKTFICRYEEDLEAFDFQRYLGRDDIFAIRKKADSALIGIFVECERKEHSLEIGYGIGSAHWGKGYVTEAVKGMLSYYAKEDGIQTVYASFFPENTASRRVMEKNGMTFSHVNEKELVYLEKERDLVYFKKELKETAMSEKRTMKAISWNVNGLRAVVGKNFSEAFSALDADFFCLQETKLQEGQLVLNLPGYEQYWNYAEKKGYSGTAVFTRHKPLTVTYGMGIEEHDHEGRVITLEYETFFLVTVYTPNSKQELERLAYRQVWEDDFRAYLLGLKAKKSVVVCGDMNVAHEEIDLKNPSSNHHNAGFTDEERAKMTALLDAGFVDTFRYFYPDAKDRYSWWSYRFHAREKNAGWRIDYFLVSEDMKDRLLGAEIHDGITGSDHCPVEVTFTA